MSHFFLSHYRELFLCNMAIGKSKLKFSNCNFCNISLYIYLSRIFTLKRFEKKVWQCDKLHFLLNFTQVHSTVIFGFHTVFSCWCHTFQKKEKAPLFILNRGALLIWVTNAGIWMPGTGVFFFADTPDSFFKCCRFFLRFYWFMSRFVVLLVCRNSHWGIILCHRLLLFLPLLPLAVNIWRRLSVCLPLFLFLIQNRFFLWYSGKEPVIIIWQRMIGNIALRWFLALSLTVPGMSENSAVSGIAVCGCPVMAFLPQIWLFYLPRFLLWFCIL